MVADSKKVQTVINVVGQKVQAMRNLMADISVMKAKWAAANPDVTGTPLEGNVAALNAAMAALETEINGVVFTQLIAARVPSHNNEALD